tara:strand:+ start:486 stop:1106 length:621 start_codon:yes stop_codon:yes gene_type:complete
VNAIIQKCNTDAQINNSIINLNPVLFTINYPLDVKDFIYMDNKEIKKINIKKEEKISIEKNKELIKLVDENYLKDIFKDYKLPLISNKSVSIYKNHNYNQLKHCFHNHTILTIIGGNAKIFLFNPKHKDEILQKDINTIKKWGNIKVIQKGDSIVIPPNWYYFLEIKEYAIILHQDINNIFTFIPNYIRENYTHFKFDNIRNKIGL